MSFPSVAFQCWPLSILCISAPRRASACPSPRICRVLFLPCCLSLVTSCCHSLSRSRSEALRPHGVLTVKKKLLGQRKLLTAEKEPAGQKATYEYKQCRNGLRKIRFANRTTLPLELYSGRNKCSTVGAHISDLKPLRVPSSPLRPRRPVHQSPEVSKPDAGIKTSRHHVATGPTLCLVWSLRCGCCFGMGIQ